MCLLMMYVLQVALAKPIDKSQVSFQVSRNSPLTTDGDGISTCISENGASLVLFFQNLSYRKSFLTAVLQ